MSIDDGRYGLDLRRIDRGLTLFDIEHDSEHSTPAQLAEDARAFGNMRCELFGHGIRERSPKRRRDCDLSKQHALTLAKPSGHGITDSE